MKTTNGGLNWTADPNILQNYFYNAVYAFDENNIIVTSNNRVIVKTTNAGVTWVSMLFLINNTLH
ncbi:MAG: hypothetical protein R3A12_17280 [Ignavibacteria bacterium]